MKGTWVFLLKIVEACGMGSVPTAIPLYTPLHELLFKKLDTIFSLAFTSFFDCRCLSHHFLRICFHQLFFCCSAYTLKKFFLFMAIFFDPLVEEIC